MIEPLDLERWLELSGDPSDGGLYFLGPGERRITFYCQQVRALRLVHALAATGRVKAGDDVAVAGAGASGLTAAVALALVGASVVLYDPADTVVQLQSGSARLLHPHLYEWPDLGSFDTGAGLPILDWTADTAGKVCGRLQAEFASYQAALGGDRLAFRKRQTLEKLARAGPLWEVTTSEQTDGKKAVRHVRQFKTVVLATGFGTEAPCKGGETLGYWKAGSVDAIADEPNAGVRYLISGTGDGGLTDLMALLVKDFQHVTFADQLFGNLGDDVMRQAVRAALAGAKLDTDLRPGFTKHILPVLTARNILDKLAQRLRTDRTVTLNSDRPIFAYGRAARLNQVMAFAILEAAQQAGRPVQIETGRLGEIAKASGKDAATSVTLVSDGLSRTISVDRVLCRHGPNVADHYAFAEDEFGRYDTLRNKTLGKHPELDVPPVLDSSTYSYFEALDINLKAPGVAAALGTAASQRDAAVSIGMDAATRELTQRGSIDVATLAAACERLTDLIEIHLHVAPDDLPGSANFVRLAHASGGRIRLLSGPEVLAAWKRLNPKMMPAPVMNWRHRPILLGSLDLQGAVEDCLLRLLDDEIARCLATGRTLELDAISPQITAALTAEWAVWRSAIAGSPILRARFLRWLFSVEPAGDPAWSGLHSEVSAMGSALVLMLATHLGEPLTPAIFDRGNLSFGSGAVAVGSGCSRVESGLITDWTDPEQWGVDAVVLSSVQELQFVSASDRLTGADKPIPDLLSASRIAPAVIQNNRAWRANLAAGTTPWVKAVQAEFGRWRERQEKAVERFKP